MELIFLVVTVTWSLPCSSPLSSECNSKVELPTIVQQMPDFDTCMKAGAVVTRTVSKTSFVCSSDRK